MRLDPFSSASTSVVPQLPGSVPCSVTTSAAGVVQGVRMKGSQFQLQSDAVDHLWLQNERQEQLSLKTKRSKRLRLAAAGTAGDISRIRSRPCVTMCTTASNDLTGPHQTLRLSSRSRNQSQSTPSKKKKWMDELNHSINYNFRFPFPPSLNLISNVNVFK